MENESTKSLEDEASDMNHEAYGRGAKLYDQGLFSLAKNEFKVALDYWPEDPEAWMALGNCFDEMKKPKRAEECFRKALVFCSMERKPDIYFNIGNSLLDQCLFEEAIECYQRVTAQSPVYGKAQKKHGACQKWSLLKNHITMQSSRSLRSLGHLTAPRLCYRKATAPSNAAYCGVR